MEKRLEVLIRATEQLQYPTPTMTGPTVVSEAQRSFASTIIRGSITPRTFAATCTDETGAFYETLWGPWGRTAPIFQCQDPGGCWTLGDGFLRQTDGETAELLFRVRRDLLSQGEAVSSVIVFTALPSGFDFPDPVPVPEGLTRPWFLERGLAFTLLGRPALIREVHVPELESFGHSVAIAWVGEPLGDSMSRSLQVLLSFICGGWVEPVMSYTADASGDQLTRDLFKVNEPLKRKATPPIDLYVQENVRAIGEQFDTLLGRCSTLLSKAVRIDVALRHLLAAHDAVDVEIRDIVLALDVIVESPLFEPSRNELIDRRRFDALMSSIQDIVQRSLGSEDSRFVERLWRLLSEARFDSVGDRRRKFWSAIGFAPTDHEKAALKLRHAMSHSGFIKTDGDSDEHWISMSNSRFIARTLVNRTILALLGFRGDAANYFDGLAIPVAPAVL